MYHYTIRYRVERQPLDFVTSLEWHTPIQKGDTLLLIYKADVLPEEAEKIVPEAIHDMVAWKVDNVVHFPNCSLKDGPTILLVSPTERPAGA